MTSSAWKAQYIGQIVQQMVKKLKPVFRCPEGVRGSDQVERTHIDGGEAGWSKCPIFGGRHTLNDVPILVKVHPHM